MADYIRISQSLEVTTTVMTIFSVPSPYIARLERLSISNSGGAGTNVLVQLFSLNGSSASTPILSVEVPGYSTVIYEESQVPRQATPTGFGVTSSIASKLAPIYVDFTVTLE